MENYSIELITPDGKRKFKCSSTDYILDGAEQAGIDLPFGCRAGACSSCNAKIISGEVDQTEQSYLSEKDIKNTNVLLCVAYPLSDCVFETHQDI